MATAFKLEGLKELESALNELPRAAARSTLQRVLKKAGAPIAKKAAQLAPDDPATKRKDLHRSIKVSPRIKNDTGKAEYGAVLRAGGTKAEAQSALRDARRAGGEAFAEMHVGPVRGRNSHVGSLREFGTIHQAAHPFMRPAWEQHKEEAAHIIRSEMSGEIEKTAKRLAARAAAKAAKG